MAGPAGTLDTDHALACEVKVLGVIRDAWSPTVKIISFDFGFSRLLDQLKAKRNRMQNLTKYIGKTKNHIEYQNRKNASILYKKTENQTLKNKKSAQTAMNAKTEILKSFATKMRNQSKKIAKTAKPKIPMSPSSLF